LQHYCSALNDRQIARQDDGAYEIALEFSGDIRMNDLQRLRLAGWCGIVGGILWFVLTLIFEVLFPNVARPGTPNHQILLLFVDVVLRVDRWHGWARFAPLLVALWAILTELVPVILVGQPLPEVYSAFWGLFSALLGWAVLTQASSLPIRSIVATARS
jgi:hypothetical protein